MYWYFCEPKFYIYRNKFNILAEPVGAKAPTFSSDALSQTISRKEGQGFALLCQAQGFPVPLFRYASYSENFIELFLL